MTIFINSEAHRNYKKNIQIQNRKLKKHAKRKEKMEKNPKNISTNTKYFYILSFVALMRDRQTYYL